MKAKEIWIAVNPENDKDVAVSFSEPEYSDTFLNCASPVPWKHYVMFEMEEE